MPSSKTPRAARTELYADFWTFWQASAAALDEDGNVVRVMWDNIDAKTDGSEFVFLQFQHIGGTIAALGNEKYRRDGIFVANIWTPEGKGQKRSDELAEAVLEYVETFNLAGWLIRDPGFIDVGVFDGYYQSNVSATLEYDALRT